ncbi:MBL fold metallo-hydrolase [Candidatus Parvarchaeota archaeon]|nr:MBL fold metallo-hydrolase [Candidatus Parvarchaeota archaeon]
MNIRFLGKWSSNLVRGERNISFALDDKIVFDFGPHTIESLLDSKIDPRDIGIVLITHMHLDHFSGLPELLWYRAIYKAQNKLIVLGPKGIKNNTERLLRTLQTPKAFNINAEFIEDKKYDFIQPFRARHIIADNGYRVDYKGKTVFYSGDTAYSSNVVKGAEDADILLHEMTYLDNKKEEADFWRHSTYSSAMQVFEESRAKKLAPVHLSVDSNKLALKLSKSDKRIIYPNNIIHM